MHIVVLLKQVPATENVRLDPETGTMVRDARDSVLNPLDGNALTEACRLKALIPDVTVTVVSMGPEAAAGVLREGIAGGAESAVLLSHRAFAGSDTIATSRVLAAALKRLMPVDLVLAGERATDGETGQTAPMVAARLDMPVVTFVRRMAVRDGVLTAERIVEDGYEQVQVGLPAVVTVVKDINEPGSPSLHRLLAAKRAAVAVWGPEELGLAPGDLGLKGSPTRVVKVFSPKLARDTVMLTSMDAGIKKILEKLAAVPAVERDESHA